MNTHHALKLALELLAVATYHSPDLQAKRTEVIDAGLKALAQPDAADLLEYADWLDEAAADIEDWSLYASKYHQEKWKRDEMVALYQARAEQIRMKVTK